MRVSASLPPGRCNAVREHLITTDAAWIRVLRKIFFDARNGGLAVSFSYLK
jgi:hypothetical protein